MKVVSNFSCNGLKKKAGESLSEDELEIIGPFLDQLKANDLIRGESKKKSASPVINPVVNSDSNDDVVELSLEELKEECKKRALKFHHRAGADKLKELLEASE